MSAPHLRNHLDTHKEDKRYKCERPGCDQSFSRLQRLNVHIKKHDLQKDFRCPIKGCPRAFYEKGNLKTHLRLHTGEKPYHCKADGCYKSFTTQGHLNDHFSKNHGENFYKNLTTSQKKKLAEDYGKDEFISVRYENQGEIFLVSDQQPKGVMVDPCQVELEPKTVDPITP